MTEKVVEENSILKREVAIAEKKLKARNELIHNLEKMREEAEHRLSMSNAKFEGQLQALRERLEQSRGASSEIHYIPY